MASTPHFTTLIPASSTLITQLSVLSRISSTPTSNNIASATQILLPKLAGDAAHEGKQTSGRTIGLSIGLPVGIFCLGLLLFLCYFYLKKKIILDSNAPISPDMDFHNDKNSYYHERNEQFSSNNWFTNLIYSNGKVAKSRNPYLNSKDEELGNYHHQYSDRIHQDDIDWQLGCSMNSKIQYKISAPMPKPEHILTPKKTVTTSQLMRNSLKEKYENISTSNDNDDTINTLLYSKPPNIFHLGSGLSNPSPSSTTTKNHGSTSNKKTKKQWKYESPLSSWFLRNSTYFKELNPSSTSGKIPCSTNSSHSNSSSFPFHLENSIKTRFNDSIKSPAVQLKKLKILSRTTKNNNNTNTTTTTTTTPAILRSNTLLHHHSYFAEEIFPQKELNESSPILEKFRDSILYPNDNSNLNTTPSTLGPSSTLNNESVQRPSSAVYGTIGPQFLDKNDDSCMKIPLNDHSNHNVPVKIDSHIDPGKNKKKRKKRRQSKLRKHIEYVSNFKPLPNVPSSSSSSDDYGMKLNAIYKVIQRYDAKLADEINITIGEYVKVLASHSDGWCLVEKCDVDGNETYIDNNDNEDKVEMAADALYSPDHYLNDNRGIVPGDCLIDI
ncbi:Fus1p NDAI_0A00480 [Naumovozyma dairenensis CBS 421]|uniref:SH3 domain-containing protein n=1 Tax=Naumovozyma dairenensis (strain ATCC 10597 / BCRC 20456 / CBS 421 / NBRC 0211 / NRRL Y-12639) TaxID=1071378 RepID=G0W318_NAUDC|nr:hypothetical protein NDAI_0A00480 [Naumovozyma dairenensis CBS 421]CCD22206.1 hypothetical protein NDAI_0A00480 [Naumovozyma dairenensis CBS 421]